MNSKDTFKNTMNAINDIFHVHTGKKYKEHERKLQSQNNFLMEINLYKFN